MKDSNLEKEHNKDYIINLINELKTIKNEADSLYQNNKIEESKNKFLEAYNLYEKDSSKVINEYYEDNNINELNNIYKNILSNLALCYYNQNDYKDAIIYDLKFIALEPKNVDCIIRLFYSYSKLNKYLQAVFFGDVFLDLEYEIKNKVEDISPKIIEEKKKLKKFQENYVRKNLLKLFGSILIIILPIILFYLFKKNNNK